jgi:hypothetical protein
MKPERRCSIGKQGWVHWNSPEIFDKEMARQLLITDRPRRKHGDNQRDDSKVS